VAGSYDVIVVGARCAGSPTAMLLARRGWRVLVVDRATFPSDTLSTHIVHPPGVASLQRWGLLDRLVATGCPPIDRYVFDFGAVVLSGSPGNDTSPVGYCPRRTVLDALLVDAAREAGAEVREGFTVDELVVEDDRVVGVRGHARDGETVTELASVVVGADGRFSLIARSVRSEQYHEKPPLLSAYYAYWSDLPMDGCFVQCARPGQGFAAAPTHDGLTLVIAGWSFAAHEANKHDIEGSFLGAIETAPEFADRMRRATRETRFAGTSVPGYFRRPYGPGWALVGDAGYNKDFITAQGILDAFRDAELCAHALDEALSGTRPFDNAMCDYQTTRDEHVLPMYEFTSQLATLEPPSAEMQELLAAIAGNQAAMDGFARVNAGVTSPAEFFSETNIGRILAAA
jgi:2-polyprenyl-6-methoxyphenol hydroxylase-like FAD-dependent oxidoreductase